MSSCFTKVVRDIVQLQWDNYENVDEAIADEARDLGIPSAQIPQLVSWAKAQHNTNYLVYSEIEPALELRRRFVTDASTHVVGIGLHTSLVDSFRSQLAKDVNRGTGLAELVGENRPPEEGGNALGFEPLGFEATKFHSWLCHNAPDEAYKRFGIRPNRLGLIDDLYQARQVNEFLLQTGAEPAIWEPWLLLEYAQ
jgi:preprotein translocase subunit SecA